MKYLEINQIKARKFVKDVKLLNSPFDVIREGTKRLGTPALELMTQTEKLRI